MINVISFFLSFSRFRFGWKLEGGGLGVLVVKRFLEEKSVFYVFFFKGSLDIGGRDREFRRL